MFSKQAPTQFSNKNKACENVKQQKGYEEEDGIGAENKKTEYDEIYRRLVCIPTTTEHALEGDRYADEGVVKATKATASSKANSSQQKNPVLYNLFVKFDKNANGLISKDEFQEAMKELNISMSPDDCQTLFNRFDSEEADGQIDWSEFVHFFDTNGPEQYSSSLGMTVCKNQQNKANITKRWSRKTCK